MSYTTPLRDIRFAMKELAGLDEILKLPGFEEAEPDLVDAILDENARFVQEVVAPLNVIGDRQPPVWKDGAVTATPGFAKAFAEYSTGGWQGLQHPVQWGGQGLPQLVAAPAGENIQAASLAFALCPMLTDGVIEALLTVGSEEQRRAYIPNLIGGRWTGTMNLTEPQAGSDLALVSTRAVPQDDGSYRVSGQKIFITFGEHDLAENIIHLVLARLPDAPAGVKGISLFIVPKFLVNEDGSLGKRNDVWCASLEHKLGIHGSPTAVLLYGAGKGEVGEGAVGYLVGEANRGLEYMFIMMNASRYSVGQQGIALAERAYQHAQEYARERVQGRAIEGSAGPVTISHHPDVQRMLLTMRSLTEAARAVSYVAAAAHDKANHHPDAEVRARNRAFYEYLVPIVKGFSTESAVEVASLGVQVHGGMGFIEETGAAQYYRDARILPIYEGTTAIQANDLVGRKTLRDGGAAAHASMAAMRDTLKALQAETTRADAESREGLCLLRDHFDQAIQAYEAAVEYVLLHAVDHVRAVFSGSVPYLMLAGVVHGGWQMARAALVCNRRLAEGSDDGFYRQKLGSALFYGAHILPRALSLSAAVRAGQVADTAADWAAVA
ncbi:acyl-CoA dehydrogenase [Bordetella holmesii]|uniref:3-methylmercaptopropionyl-CoA dehydrogenase n=2 Tax=Bordetella holmesii TaxID=35814 RepID=A0A158MA07_9BORD|nr:acyl-CoA dehydrogenase [Bordetella holmesii]AHV91060.1 acyl-CoA dehydrogenase, N-terminal domain protein [Bordetella holmesii ATCC 51541]AIT27142.1 acyl-CoA dehydrogenase, N-terminal domain protein [Bordetella holmesii 44057]EWM42315.1 acyl-CoA dehydrogenase, N-terminal domain protein [Bordetella holmesii 41130]EWM47726.1 acyl-CoA dehydrogenase, N-terminal domain protein [Bordetella holmesii 35009]EWM51896.1 acyl-CoA dehydrogenase, N-terminal domain protein [Bordetella holmesii 70147]